MPQSARYHGSVQYIDSSGRLASVHPDIARMVNIKSAESEAEAAEAAAEAAAEEAAVAEAAAEEAERALRDHEYTRLARAADSARERRAAARQRADKAQQLAGQARRRVPSGSDRVGAERAARAAGWTDDWQPPGQLA